MGDAGLRAWAQPGEDPGGSYKDVEGSGEHDLQGKTEIEVLLPGGKVGRDL